MQKENCFPEKVWQIAEEREVKSKEERERYTQLSPELQRIAQRDKKTFLKKKKKKSKEIKENYSMGKARGLLKKIGDIKGTFHVWMGMLEDINNKDLT